MSDITWSIKNIAVNELKEFKKNPRKLMKDGLDHLEKSIKKFGMAEPLVVNLDNVICGGHGRKKVLKRLDINTVDCYVPSRLLSDKEFEELNIRLNKNIAGTFDFDILANEFEMDELLDWGFDEIDLGLDGPEPGEGQPDKMEKIMIKCLAQDKDELKEFIEMKIKETSFLKVKIS